MNPIAFTKVKLPFGWLSNMSPHLVIHEGRVWRTTEHLFQALRFKDPVIQENIRLQASPMAAKLLAKSKAEFMVITPRGFSDQNNMYLCLRLKAEQHPELKRALLETGDAELIEDVTRRPNESGLFWGAARKGDGWEGQNVLGKLWMKLRTHLREEPFRG